MSDPPERGFVCSFGDPTAQLGGLAWDVGDPGALLLDETGVTPASFAVEEGGDATVLEIAAGERKLEATLSPLHLLRIEADSVHPYGLSASVCRAELRAPGGKRTVECPGEITHWIGGMLAGEGTFRHLAVAQPGPQTLVVTALGAPNANHSDEEIEGHLIGESSETFDESLISTQYDGSGDPTRFGLELWPPDADQTARAAATRVSASLLGGARSGGAWGGLFRCHTDGIEGIGTYLLWRA